MTRSVTIADYRALARFRHALRVFLRFSEDAAREAGLTPAQHQLLLAIKGHPSGAEPTMSYLADVLQLRLHSCSELVDRAAERGLVERTHDPVDQRRCRLHLTAIGEAKLAELSVLHRHELRQFRHEMNDVLRELD
jgi:DNA-binding MarR family transcriptional regulator